MKKVLYSIIISTALVATPVVVKKPTTATTNQTFALKPEAGSGPFGFDAGMSFDTISALVGKDNITKEDEYAYSLTTAPKPHPLIKTYIAIFNKDKKLVKLVAYSKSIQTSMYGDEFLNKFNDLEHSIITAYGQGQRFDYLKKGSIWNDPRDWMMGLLKKERHLVEYWSNKNGDPIKNEITCICLEAKPVSLEKGYLILGYEFKGFNEFVDQNQTNTDSVF